MARLIPRARIQRYITRIIGYYIYSSQAINLTKESRGEPSGTPLKDRGAYISFATWFGLTITTDDQDHLRWMSYICVCDLLATIFLAFIGNSPISLPMPTHTFGVVDPTCGLTRGSTSIARGDFALAWHYNPASFLVIGFGLFGVIRLVIGLITHRWFNVSFRPSRWGWLFVSVFVAALWINQQTNAHFIIHSRL